MQKDLLRKLKASRNLAKLVAHIDSEEDEVEVRTYQL
jgi:hypothetical protein